MCTQQCTCCSQPRLYKIGPPPGHPNCMHPELAPRCHTIDKCEPPPPCPAPPVKYFPLPIDTKTCTAHVRSPPLPPEPGCSIGCPPPSCTCCLPNTCPVAPARYYPLPIETAVSTAYVRSPPRPCPTETVHTNCCR